jgi:TolA-binding protein
MSAMPSAMQADFSAGSLPVKPPPLDSSPLLHAGDLDDGPLADDQLQPVRGRPLGLVSLLVTFCCGIALTVAWYSFGGPIRVAIADMSPGLAWLAPQPAEVAQSAVDPAAPAAPTLDQQLNAASLDIDAVRQNVDRIATSQEQIKRSIDQLSAGQEQLTKEIAKLQAVEQYILYKNSEPPATRAPAPAPAAAAAPRRPAGPLPLTPAPPQTSQPPAPR